MNKLSRRAMMVSGAAALAGCTGRGPRFLRYTGPEVTSVVANKGARSLFLFHNSSVLQSYRFELGFAPEGHKQVEGDGRTPEGLYFIDRRNPESEFHLSLGISYPNDTDRAAAAALGMPPGGDIFIHGTPRYYVGQSDWTVGCLAVMNDEIEVIYSMVKNGTPIWINP